MKRKPKNQSNITTKVLFSEELPALTFRKEIGGTVYTVTASYDGKQALTAKLLEILMKETEETY